MSVSKPATHDFGSLHTVLLDDVSRAAIPLPAHAAKGSPSSCRAAARDLRLVLNPREGASRRGEAKRANSKNDGVVDLFLTEAGFSGVANRGVRGTLETSANRESKFDQSARAFIKWTRLMTPFAQMCECAPDVRIQTLELRDGLRKLLSHAACAPFQSICFSTQFSCASLAIRQSIQTTARLLMSGSDHRST